MSAFVLDTHQIILRLQKSGFESVQAEALTTELKEIANLKNEGLATKDDIVRLEEKISDTKISLIQWMIAIAFAQVGAMLAVLSLVL